MKRNLLLLHGALGSKAQFNSMLESLSLNFNVYAPDLPGHGANNFSGPFSMDMFANFTLDYINSHQIWKTDIFGFSMGGYVGLHLALLAPELVNRIICLGTKFDWTPDSAEKEMKMLDPEKIAMKVPAFSAHLNRVHTGNPWRNVLLHTSQMMRELGSGKKLNAEDLNGIAQEVYILRGKLDSMVSAEESEEAADQLRNGHFIPMEGFMHPLERNDPEKLVSVIFDLLVDK